MSDRKERLYMIFYIGLHKPQHAPKFRRAMLSINVLKNRKSDFYPRDWILDSGGFTEVAKHGCFRTTVEEHAEHIERWSRCGNLLAAVSQDYLCEETVLQKTGKTVAELQELTTLRYESLRHLVNPRIGLMPVLQGQTPQDYARHAKHYGSLLPHGSWTGVGSVCRRQRRPAEVLSILLAIKEVRPDLRLHGFGVKLTSLSDGAVRSMLFSADSLAWSFAAWKNGRNQHDPKEAADYLRRIETMPLQPSLDGFYPS